MGHQPLNQFWLLLLFLKALSVKLRLLAILPDTARGLFKRFYDAG